MGKTIRKDFQKFGELKAQRRLIPQEELVKTNLLGLYQSRREK